MKGMGLQDIPADIEHPRGITDVISAEMDEVIYRSRGLE